MINLFEDFCYNEKEGLFLIPYNMKKMFYYQNDFNELLEEKLEEGRKKHDFINLKGIRGIGKLRH